MENNRCIVVIDDLQDNLVAISALLSEFFPDVRIFTATSGNEGLLLATEKQPSVILLDLVMPNMDGFEVCRILKSQPDTLDIPVIILTANRGDSDARIRALDLGAEAFLSKPIEEAEFIAQVRSMIKISDANLIKKNEQARLEVLVEERTTQLRKQHMRTLHLMEQLRLENEQRKLSQEALEEAQNLARITSFATTDKGDNIRWTEEALEIFEIANFDLINSFSKFASFLDLEDHHRLLHSKQLVDEEGKSDSFQARIKLHDNSYRYIEVRVNPIFNHSQQSVGAKGTVQDITKTVNAEQEMIYLSEHDFLTGLYNRMYIEEKMKKLDQRDFYPISLVMADVNGLKMINDSFGHAKGDEILQSAARVLRNTVGEQGTVARLGGDEFLILLPRTDENETEDIIQRIKDSAMSPTDHLMSLSISCGYGTKHFVHEPLSTILRRAEDDMYRHKITESSSMRSKSVDLIMTALFAKTPREMNHSRRVSEICEAIAKHVFTNQDAVDQMRIAGLLHDIGKIGVDEAILNKNGKLDANEWIEVKKHSEIGYRILSSVNEFSDLVRFVLEHHEKMDGSGYPAGLTSNQISIQAKIISVADAFDAMTSDRTYRKGLSTSQAIDEIRKYTGTQFDASIVKVFVEEVLGEK
ncbi:MAG: diguanylate cyclase [Candidatus Izemoplasmatales bacterium]|nr:diguanylate cyclase [Candidatus Izemoplasmatales bacterium]